MTLGYVLSRYPLLSETFILREMWELERQGVAVRVYPLRRVRGRRHARVAALRAPVWHAPWWGGSAHGYWLLRRPGRYLSTLAEVVWRNRGDGNLLLGALAYWGKAVALAVRMRRDGVTQVHAHYATHPALVAYVVRRLAGLPFTFTVHAHDIFCHRAMLATKARAAQAVVAISEYNRRLLAAELGAPCARVEVIHCGIEWRQYAALATARCSAPQTASPAHPLRLLAIGSLQPYKGHRVLLDAGVRLRERGLAFCCRIVGGGELARRLQRQARQSGLAETVEWAGAATEAEVLSALRWADVLVLPSVVMASGKMEGIPVVLMEAMAAGLPVVASRLSGIPELVEDGRSGVLVPPGDAAALADALAGMTDPARRRAMGLAGCSRVSQDFELSRTAQQLLRLWTQLGRRTGEAAA
ncbi:MAG TPA: glycosyltransferase family 4 protein [Terriglobales bacterium]|nr:glycosyltransferase family 4 protein [Terriglobales bacterium]